MSSSDFITSDTPPTGEAHSSSSSSRRAQEPHYGGYGHRTSAQTVMQQQAGTTPEVALNATQVRRAWAALRHHKVKPCLAGIMKRLFSGTGLVLHRGNEPQRPKGAFEAFLHRDMLPFARDALAAIYAIGVVPIAFRRPQVYGLGEDKLAPYVPTPGSYTITVRAVAGLLEYKFYWNANAFAPPSSSAAGEHHTLAGGFGAYDPEVIVRADFDFNPTLTGELTSNMCIVDELLTLTARLTENMMIAEVF
jgi:hypothetical protein